MLLLISGLGLSGAIGQSSSGALIGQRSGGLFSYWWNETGGGAVFAQRSSGLHVGKKEKTDGKNCNLENYHCPVTLRYGNILTLAETHVFVLLLHFTSLR